MRGIRRQAGRVLDVLLVCSMFTILAVNESGQRRLFHADPAFRPWPSSHKFIQCTNVQFFLDISPRWPTIEGVGLPLQWLWRLVKG